MEAMLMPLAVAWGKPAPVPPPVEHGAMTQAVQLVCAFASTLSGADPAALGSSVPKASGGLGGVDAGVFTIFALILFAFNWGFRLGVVEPFARRTLTSRSGNSPSKAKVQKFAQAAMEIIFYGVFATSGAVILYSQAWAWPSSRWWEGMHIPSSHLVMRDDLRCFYLLYAARYLQGFISVCLEHKRKDFLEMQLHHSVTFVLVTLSYLYGFNRVGLVVMTLLDPADVPLHSAKLCKYLGEARRTAAGASNLWLFAADRLFEIFAVTFFVTRLGLYPYVCWSAHFESSRFFVKQLPDWTCVALLEVLLLLQAFWGFLIVKVAVKMMTHGHVDDIRSDDEEEDPKRA